MVVDITDKLNFEENPKLIVCGQELEVNGDAETMLKLMAVFNQGEGIQAVNNALDLIFSEKDRKKIAKISKDGKKLSASGLITIVNEAVDLLTGQDKGNGNEDPTTT